LIKSQAFDKNARLLTASDYSKVFQNTKLRASTKHFLVLATPNEGLGLRLGLIVAKKHVRLAVQRNRLKRLARESFRTMSPTIKDLDIVLLARQQSDSLSNKECAESFDRLWFKLANKSKAS